MNDREKSELVRLNILKILWERGDSSEMLRSSDLASKDFAQFLKPSAEWLEHEGLIRLGNSRFFNGGEGAFASASLTRAGETLLSQKPDSSLKSFGGLISEAFKDAAKDGLKDLIKLAPSLIGSIYSVYKSNQ